MLKLGLRLLLAFFILIAIAIGVYFLPPVHERLAWRVDNLRAQVLYIISPPEKAVFIPQQAIDRIVAATMAARPATPSPTPLPPTQTPSPAQTQPGPSATPEPSATPTLTPTAIPAQVTLAGVIHEYQTWNNCGPATLAMGLSFWKWKGDQRDTAAFLKPNSRDKNVMPYEMKDYVDQKTNFKAIVRVGGDQDTLKRFVAAGFPVIIEKGLEVSGEGWMGHYALVSGYNDNKSQFITQDSYSQPENMDYLAVSYAEVQTYWRQFNNLYLVIYPYEREQQVFDLLGPQADEQANFQYAAQKASDDIATMTGRDLFFAWYDRGTNLVNLGDYAGAAQAYDQAFQIYPTIPEKKRPWRMIWYQTGPYFAYFYSGRYQDVINLATTTLSTMSEQSIEETWVWRARARAALGDTAGAISDLQNALKWHPGFAPAVDELNRLGVTQ